MKNLFKYLLIAASATLLNSSLNAQDSFQEMPENKKKNSLGIGVGLAYIPKGITSKGDGAAGIGLELVYDRILNDKWYFLTAAEWELKEYAVKYKDEVIKSKNILILSAGIAYKVLPRLKIAIGPAYEIARDNQYFTANFMAKYEIFSTQSVKGNIGTYLAWRIDRYYSVGLNFSISKSF